MSCALAVAEKVLASAMDTTLAKQYTEIVDDDGY